MRILPTISAPNPTTPSGQPTTGSGSGTPGPPGPQGPQGPPGVGSQVIEETLAGTVDGSNATFTATQSPLFIIGVDLNGQLLRSGTDFTVSGLTITTTLTALTGSAAPQTGDLLRIRYVV